MEVEGWLGEDDEVGVEVEERRLGGWSVTWGLMKT